VVQSFRNETFDKNIMKEMGALGFLGPLLTDMVVRVLIMFRMV
jgi:hypothetical protein